MERQLSVPEEPGQHGEHMLSQYCIHKRLLPDERFRRATGWQGIACIQRRFGNLREQLIDAGQPCGALFAIGPQWLTQDKLARVGSIPGIQPKMEATGLEPHNAAQCGARRAGIDAADQKVAIGQIPPAPDVRWPGDPIQSPKEIQPLNQNMHFVQADLACRKRLPHTVSFRNAVSVDRVDLNARWMTRGE